MNVILKQSGNKVGVYIDKTLATVFENKDIDFVAKWVKLNFKYTEIQIAK
jgi:Fe-S cluster assembly iron-binding protein IscA